MPGENQGRRVCLAIGIANAKSLAWLPGAANAARDIGDWARCSNFDAVTVLTDEPSIGHSRWLTGHPEPDRIDNGADLGVTTRRVAEEIARLLPAGEATRWFVLHFAGHGLRQDGTRTLWLPSNWKTARRAIAVETLKYLLESYGIENLTIISDACRDFANTPDLANLTADGLIDAGPVQQVQPALDRFNAVEDGKPAFMVPGERPEDARCILSGTIANAVLGHEPKAFDPHSPDQVLSYSLIRFVAAEARAIGARYGLDSKADTVRGAGGGNPDMVYFDRNRPPDPQAPPIVWPSPKPAAPPPGELPPAAVEAAVERIERIERNAPSIAGEISGRGSGLGSLKGIHDLAFAIDRQDEPGLTDERRRLRQWRTEVAAESVQLGLVRQTRIRKRSAIRTALREGQRRTSRHANLFLRGGRPVRIWSPKGAVKLGRTKSWRVEVARGAAQIMIEYDDGLFAPAVVYGGLDTVLARSPEGRIAGWMCVPPNAAGTANLSVTTDAISRLQTANLSPVDVDRLATGIRHQKHLNPMLGAIAAYLYDYIGDRDNIRRMAWYYARNGQPIPYDIVLLGSMTTQFDGGIGCLTTRIPPVPKREAAGPGRQELPEFATRATPARTGAVAGLCPWLRQGWDYVAAPEKVEQAMTSPLRQALPHRLDSSFTALSRDGAEALIQLWQLEADR